MIAPSAKLSSGHEAPRSKRRHGQHAVMIPPAARSPQRRANPGSPGWTARPSPATLEPGHGAGRRTGSTPVASNAGS